MSNEGTLQLTDSGLTIMREDSMKFSQSGAGKGTTRWMVSTIYSLGECLEIIIRTTGSRALLR
jgi:hypothetical protein